MTLESSSETYLFNLLISVNVHYITPSFDDNWPQLRFHDLINDVIDYHIKLETMHGFSHLKKVKIQPLFTLGKVYSTSASGAEQTTETNSN